MMAVLFLAGFFCGAIFMGVVGYAYNRGRRSRLVELIDGEDLEWNHPEIAHLLTGKAPISRLN